MNYIYLIPKIQEKFICDYNNKFIKRKSKINEEYFNRNFFDDKNIEMVEEYFEFINKKYRNNHILITTYCYSNLLLYDELYKFSQINVGKNFLEYYIENDFLTCVEYFEKYFLFYLDEYFLLILVWLVCYKYKLMYYKMKLFIMIEKSLFSSFFQKIYDCENRYQLNEIINEFETNTITIKIYILKKLLMLDNSLFFYNI